MKKLLCSFLLVFILGTDSFSQILLPADKTVLDSIKESNKGNVMLFNFWATWCKPCVQEFPDLMKINNEFKDKNFKLIFVTLDFGDENFSETKAFLKKQGVDFVTYYNNFKKDDELISYMDKNWDGGIPGSFFYDENGVLRKTFIGKRKYENFKEVITDIIKKSKQ